MTYNDRGRYAKYICFLGYMFLFFCLFNTFLRTLSNSVKTRAAADEKSTKA